MMIATVDLSDWSVISVLRYAVYELETRIAVLEEFIKIMFRHGNFMPGGYIECRMRELGLLDKEEE